MNYLAHIFLSGNDRCIQIGNFIGDGVKGDGYKQYPRKFQQGILLHREIDAFSDRHPLVREAVGIGRETFGRYSAVVNDILFDYFLASRFQECRSSPQTVQPEVLYRLSLELPPPAGTFSGVHMAFHPD